MLPGLDAKVAELRQKRKERSMTQTELARRAGVSQSFVAKLEAGEVSPGYERVRRLEEALEDENGATVEPHIRPAVTVDPDGPAVDAARTVLEAGYAIVARDGVQIGSIQPPHILPQTAGGLHDRTAESIMSEAFPELSPHASETSLRSLLSHSPVVVIVDDGAITGAVTVENLLSDQMEDI